MALSLDYLTKFFAKFSQNKKSSHRDVRYEDDDAEEAEGDEDRDYRDKY